MVYKYMYQSSPVNVQDLVKHSQYANDNKKCNIHV